MDTGLAFDFEVLSTRCEKCEKNQREQSAHDFRSWVSRFSSYFLFKIIINHSYGYHSQ
jgi:hypothetical protein